MEFTMSINLTLPSGALKSELKPRITVIGVGGAGGNAVNNMIQSGLEGVEFVVANSDAQALSLSKSERRIQMGINVTQGLGAGANPNIGEAAAEESLEEILSHIRDTNMVFITAGLGGGTGTGAAPVIARAAREHGILTVGVVTKPFQFEGANRMKMAEAGLEELQQYVDTLLIIPNQNLFRVANEKTTFSDAFKMADDVLYSGVRGVTDLMVMPGLINLDFADIKSVMSEMGKAMMGTGEAEGERRATEAAEQAIANPLLDDTSMSGAKGVLINITAGNDITLFEVDEAANRIRDEVDGDVNIIFGSTFDEGLEGRVRVSVVATGIESAIGAKREPIIRKISNGYESKQITQNSNISQMPKEHIENNSVATISEIQVQKEGEAEENKKEMELDSQSVSPSDNTLEDIINAEPQIATNNVTSGTDEEIPAFLSSADLKKDVFIPDEPASALQSEKNIDPFAAADMVNANKDTKTQGTSKKTGGLSLFERVTGVGRSQKKQDQEMGDELNDEPTNNNDKSLLLSREHKKPNNVNLSDEVDNSEIVGLVDQESKEGFEENKDNEAYENFQDNIDVSITENGSEETASNPNSSNIDNNSENKSLLGGLNASDRIEASNVDDDILDIPAFLRRQAN